MPSIDVHEAQARLLQLLAQVEAGEEVVLSRNGQPVARLVSYQPQVLRQFGSSKGRITVDDSFFDSLPEEELAAWER